MEVTAKEIHEAYGTNIRKANEKYVGKTVQIEGIVERTSHDERQSEFRVGTRGGDFVCRFDNKPNGDFVKPPSGGIVAVRGNFRREDVRSPSGLGPMESGLVLEDCEWTEPKPAKLPLTVTELYQEYWDDYNNVSSDDGQTLFEARYKNKTLQITGTGKITRHYFDSLPNDFWTLVFKGGVTVELDCGAGSKTLPCYFKQINWKQVEQKSDGQIITFRGTWAGRKASDPETIRECELVK